MSARIILYTKLVTHISRRLCDAIYDVHVFLGPFLLYPEDMSVVSKLLIAFYSVLKGPDCIVSDADGRGEEAVSWAS